MPKFSSPTKLSASLLARLPKKVKEALLHAEQLHHFLETYCGDTADWPINLSADEDYSEYLALLLNRFALSLDSLREEQIIQH